MTRIFRAILTAGAILSVTTAAIAQTAPQKPTPGQGPAETTPAPVEKEPWKAPFGGTFTAGLAFVTDYAYRGISQTQRQVAVQPTLTYETASIGEAVALSAYVGGWGSNVWFPPSPTVAELDLIAGTRARALDGKLTADLGYIRYNYLGAPSDLFYDFNEFGLVLGYDFGVAQLQGALRYSPNFFGNSGNAWYKWGSLTVPLSFIKVNENVAFKVFGTLGNQYVERFANYGIGANNYWDWQLGLGASLWGFDLSLAWVSTNLGQAGCGGTMNCDSRAIFTIGKTF